MNYLLNIENWLSQPKKRMTDSGYTLTATKMMQDLEWCSTFRLLDAKDYPQNWCDITIACFKRLKAFYMIDNDADVNELEITIKIVFEKYKLETHDWYVESNYTKNLRKKLR